MSESRRAGARTLLSLAAAGVAVTLLSGCAGDPALSSVPQPTEAPRTYTGTVVDPPVPLPAAMLTGADDRPFDLRADTRAPVTLVTFVYTNCPDECPLTVSTITVALGALAPELRRSIDVVVVSADPVRDTPAVLRAWLDRFDPAYRGVTGDPAVIDKVAVDLFVPADVPGSAPGADPVDVTHGVQIFAFGADEQSLMLWGSNPTPSELAADLSQLVEQQQSRS